MAKEYPLLFGYENDVQEELHDVNEVANFIMKRGVNTDVTITTPFDNLLLNTYGIYINHITDMEYREELLKVLVPMQNAVFAVDNDTDDIDEESNSNFEMEM